MASDFEEVCLIVTAVKRMRSSASVLKEASKLITSDGTFVNGIAHLIGGLEDPLLEEELILALCSLHANEMRLSALRNGTSQLMRTHCRSALEMLRQSSIFWRFLIGTLQVDGSWLQLAQALRDPVKKLLASHSRRFLRFSSSGEEKLDGKKAFAATEWLLSSLQNAIRDPSSNAWLSSVQYIVGLMESALEEMPDEGALHRSAVISSCFYLRVLCPMLMSLHSILGKKEPSHATSRRLTWVCKLIMKGVGYMVNGTDGCNEQSLSLHQVLVTTSDLLLHTVPCGHTPRHVTVPTAPLLERLFLHSFTLEQYLSSEGREAWKELSLRAQAAGFEVQCSYNSVWKRIEQDAGMLVAGVAAAKSRTAQAVESDVVAPHEKELLLVEEMSSSHDQTKMERLFEATLADTHVESDVLTATEDAGLDSDASCLSEIGRTVKPGRGREEMSAAAREATRRKSSTCTMSLSESHDYAPREVVLKVKMDGKMKLVRLDIDDDLTLPEVADAVRSAFHVKSKSIVLDVSLGDIMGFTGKLMKCSAVVVN